MKIILFLIRSPLRKRTSLIVRKTSLVRFVNNKGRRKKFTRNPLALVLTPWLINKFARARLISSPLYLELCLVIILRMKIMILSPTQEKRKILLDPFNGLVKVLRSKFALLDRKVNGRPFLTT